MVTPASARRLVEARLRERTARRVDDGDADRRAAVVLLLRPGSGEEAAPLESLFVRRVEADGDPWSGHVGLPGGHRESGDADLAATALRELEEETGLVLPREALLGRLDDVHPRSRRLPSVAVTPFVGWLAGEATVRPGPEIRGHLWVALPRLTSRERRSVLTFRRGQSLRAFPTVEVEDHTIWGLTYLIVRRFLGLLPPELTGRKTEEGPAASHRHRGRSVRHDGRAAGARGGPEGDG